MLCNILEKIKEDKGFIIEFDTMNDYINGLIKNNNKVTVTINNITAEPLLFVLIHEITHTFKLNELKVLIIEYLKKTLKIKTNIDENELSDELICDIAGILLNDELLLIELLNNLINKYKGISKYKRFINTFMRLWKTSYDGDVYLKDVEYSIKYYNNIGYVAKYDSEKYILDNTRNLAWNIRHYFNVNLKNKIVNGQKIDQIKKYSTTGTNKYTYDIVKGPAITILDDIIKVEQNKRHENDNKQNKNGTIKKHSGLDTTGGFNHYDVYIGIPNIKNIIVIYKADCITRIDKYNREYFYDIGKIKDTGHKVVDI